MSTPKKSTGTKRNAEDFPAPTTKRSAVVRHLTKHIWDDREKLMEVRNFQFTVFREESVVGNRPGVSFSAENTVPSQVVIAPEDILFFTECDDTWTNLQVTTKDGEEALTIYYDQSVNGRTIQPKLPTTVSKKFLQKFLQKLRFWTVIKLEPLGSNDAEVMENMLIQNPRTVEELKVALRNTEAALQSERFWLNESVLHIRSMLTRPELVTPFEYAEAEIENRRLFAGLTRLEDDRNGILQLIEHKKIQQEMTKASEILNGIRRRLCA